MSTELKSLSAKIEIPIKNSITSKYIDVEVFLNKFWGGTKRGTSLQITFQNEYNEYSHIQLDSENIKQLKDILTAEFE